MRELQDYDLGLTAIRDTTTDANYIFTSYTLNPDALDSDPEWVCTRTTAANGTKVFAKHPTAPGNARVTNFLKKERLLKASLAATYSY